MDWRIEIRGEFPAEALTQEVRVTLEADEFAESPGLLAHRDLE